jgi:hypothetical protein
VKIESLSRVLHTPTEGSCRLPFHPGSSGVACIAGWTLRFSASRRVTCSQNTPAEHGVDVGAPCTSSFFRPATKTASTIVDFCHQLPSRFRSINYNFQQHSGPFAMIVLFSQPLRFVVVLNNPIVVVTTNLCYVFLFVEMALFAKMIRSISDTIIYPNSYFVSVGAALML